VEQAYSPGDGAEAAHQVGSDVVGLKSPRPRRRTAGLIWRRPAAPGFAALAITAGLIWRRPAAPGFAALAITAGLIWRRPAAPGFAALAITAGLN
jgi:hypothetical protein